MERTNIEGGAQAVCPDPLEGLSGRAESLLCYCPESTGLFQRAIDYHATFRDASPFSHVTIDGLFPDAVLDKVVDETRNTNPLSWTIWGSGSRRADAPEAAKRGIANECSVGPITRNFMLQLNSWTFLRFLGIVATGGKIPLVGDPAFWGGGLHSTGRGGHLLVHTDLERHPLGLPFCQAVNVIIFLNRDWGEDYGGHLELWSRDGKRCEKRILPIFNRTVIFESGTNTYHGHPQPVTCPPERSRQSLAAYYYMINRRQDDNYTAFQRSVGWIDDAPSDAAPPSGLSGK